MRKIVLELADNTTGRICGSCDMLDADRGGFCIAFNKYVDDEVKKTRKGHVVDGIRLDACLAAERTFSRLLDVSPEDVSSVQRSRFMDTRKLGLVEHVKLQEARGRVERAMNDHAKKAEVKP